VYIKYIVCNYVIVTGRDGKELVFCLLCAALNIILILESNFK